MARLDSSAEQPLPVRTVALAVARWVGRLGRVWVEGQVAGLSRRPGAGTVFLTLRDPVADVSLPVTCRAAVCDAVQPALRDGASVVVWARPEVYLSRGTLSLAAVDIRPVGVGALLARIERVKAALAADGLFDPARKVDPPFLPGTVGLVTGRGSAAERDLITVAGRRWPAVRFRVENVAVQGPTAVDGLVAAVRALDADPTVDVIVLARGGGSVEDLLPFSDETLCRAVAGCRTPVVSAVGHESDTPVVDLVADRRASTPTDAAKLVVPDVAEERQRIRLGRDRCRGALRALVDREQHRLSGLRTRPVLAAPGGQLAARAGQVEGWRDRGRRCLAARLVTATTDLQHARARITALSPAATLDRGYAVLLDLAGGVIRDPAQVTVGQRLTALLAGGRLPVTVAAAAPPGGSSG